MLSFYHVQGCAKNVFVKQMASLLSTGQKLNNANNKSRLVGANVVVILEWLIFGHVSLLGRLL